MNYEKMYSTIDTHVAGEAFRILTQSPIRLCGDGIQAQHDELNNNFSNEKNLLLNEPRGHRGIHGCVVVPSRVADFSLLFFNHQGVSNFKYEGILATVTALLETGNLTPSVEGLYRVETIKGIYKVKALIKNQEVTSVTIENESCYEIEANADRTLIRVDNDRNYLLYALPDSIPGIELEHLAELNRWGLERITELANENIEYVGVVVVESVSPAPGKIRSVTFEKDGYILRSPGVDSTFAILAAFEQKDSSISEIENYSVFGSSLIGKRIVNDKPQFSIETKAFITGSHEFIFDQEDPLKEGFLLV
ncbi:proline racemase family protein [Sporosarcina gallistercoris]|uniref:Proline racemase family protein n=1 Tax=Sporosarcina gallistercoris TaxID=2762245 RepID=A0ABR8PLM1_9BACL|nr:proline racemase family protein [Sporosarcina gallistercoris]MBD7909066.1 proline racemase family protein [Sporosarcina gallistercoris]